MTSPQKRKGDAWEREVVDVFRRRGVVAERCYGAGRPDDVGDIALARFPFLLLDCKNRARHELAAWVDDANRKRAHVAALIVKRPRAEPRRAYVVLDLDGFIELLGYCHGTRLDTEG